MECRPVVSASEAFRRQRAGAVIVDVREPLEFELAHVADSILIPFGRIIEDARHLPITSDILLFCRTGRRSGIAQIALMDRHGRRNVFNVVGGIVAWQLEKLPVVRCENEALCYLSHGVSPRS